MRARAGTMLASMLAAACAAGCSGELVCEGRNCQAPDASQAFDGAPTRVNAAQACAMQSTRATPGVAKQVDVVFVVDNSGSMTEEIAAIRDNINVNFAQLIEDSGVDFRFVLVSAYGTEGTTVCVDPPLSGAPCGAGLEASTSDVFFHYDLEIDSSNSLCQLLWAFDHPDPEGRAPYGYRQWLRPDAHKVFVVFTDDSADCNYPVEGGSLHFGGRGEDPYEAALSFHETLLALSPDQFGEPQDARYAFYSIVGLRPNDPPTEPFFPYQALETDSCATAPSAGLTYQALSVITDALRYPVCEGIGFDAIFRVLARSVLEAAKADCRFALPDAPPGQSISRASVNLEYTPGDGSPVRRFEQVEDADRCRTDTFYVAGDQLELCPDACSVVEADRKAEVRVLYGCNVLVK